MDPAAFLDGHPLALAVYEKARITVAGFGTFEVRTTKSQIAFRRKRGFAYLWLPGQYLAHPDAEVVLSIALGRAVPSDRFKEIAHPTPRHWMHHLELGSPDELDDEVIGWLREAYERAG